MSRLHVAFFNRAFAPEESATAQLLTELAEDLVKVHGCRVSVVAGLPVGSSSRMPGHAAGRVVWRERLGAIEIFRCSGTTWPKRTLVGRLVNYGSYFLSACWAGWRLDRPDVVIALTDPPIIGVAAWMAARRVRAKFVMAYKDLFPEVTRLLDGRRRPFIEWALHRVNRLLLHRADRIVALGQAMRDRLIREKGAPADRVVIIPDWADGQAIVPGPKRNPFSIEHGLADRFVVMHSGNLGASQNLDVLLEAAAELKDLPDLKVVLIGDGVRKAALQAQAGRLGLSSVAFLPYQPKVRLSDSFATSDCFVVSLKPGLSGYIMPSKLYGILAAGRPYVAAVDSNCDVAQITRTYRCGLLAEPGNSHDLAAKIRRLYQDPIMREAMGLSARQASAAFDRRVGVKAYAALCQELVNAA